MFCTQNAYDYSVRRDILLLKPQVSHIYKPYISRVVDISVVVSASCLLYAVVSAVLSFMLSEECFGGKWKCASCYTIWELITQYEDN